MPWGWGGVGWRGLKGKASAFFLPNNKYSYVMCRSCFLFVEEGEGGRDGGREGRESSVHILEEKFPPPTG